MTDVTVGHGNWLAQAGMNHLSQLCASSARTSSTNNQSPDSGSVQHNQAQDQSAQSVRREHATYSGGSGEPTKSKSVATMKNLVVLIRTPNLVEIRQEQARRLEIGVANPVTLAKSQSPMVHPATRDQVA